MPMMMPPMAGMGGQGGGARAVKDPDKDIHLPGGPTRKWSRGRCSAAKPPSLTIPSGKRSVPPQPRRNDGDLTPPHRIAEGPVMAVFEYPGYEADIALPSRCWSAWNASVRPWRSCRTAGTASSSTQVAATETSSCQSITRAG